MASERRILRMVLVAAALALGLWAFRAFAAGEDRLRATGVFVDEINNTCNKKQETAPSFVISLAIVVAFAIGIPSAVYTMRGELLIGIPFFILSVTVLPAAFAFSSRSDIGADSGQETVCKKDLHMLCTHCHFDAPWQGPLLHFLTCDCLG